MNTQSRFSRAETFYDRVNLSGICRAAAADEHLFLIATAAADSKITRISGQH